MKRLFLAICTLFVMACQPDNDSKSNAPVATPLDFHCINGNTNCQSSAYNQYPGWMAYPMYQFGYQFINNVNQYGFCQCPSGYTPTYNGFMGLGCVQNQMLQPFGTTFFFWAWDVWGWNGYVGQMPAAPQTVNNYPQQSNIGGAPNSAACSNQLTQSCLLSQGNTCGTGATCRTVNPGSNLGICVRN